MEAYGEPGSITANVEYMEPLSYLRELGDGRLLVVELEITGTARLAITRPRMYGVYVDEWQFMSLSLAIGAANEWDPDRTPEPDGWSRHVHTGRRRPDGDANREYVTPPPRLVRTAPGGD